MKIRGKKGDSELFFSQLIPLVIILIVLFSLVLFVSKSASSALVYEELYAKKVGLVIENGMPGLQVNVDISDLYNLWKKQGLDLGRFRGEVIVINQDTNTVTVWAGSKGNYVYPFVNENDFTYLVNFDTTKSPPEAVLTLNFKNA